MIVTLRVLLGTVDRRTLSSLCKLAALLLITLYLATPASAGMNFVINGDFETFSSGNTVVADKYTICRTSTTACVSNLANWSSTCQGTVNNLSCGTTGTVSGIMPGGSGGAQFNKGIGLWGTIPDSPTGGNYVAIDGDTNYNASISQTITGLTVNGNYVLSFYMAAAQQKGTTGANTEFWRVTFGSTTKDSVTLSNPSQGFQPWIKQTLSFTATSTSQVLTFLALGTPNGGPPAVLLDGVVLDAATPEPGTFLLLGCGLLGLATLRKRK